MAASGSDKHVIAGTKLNKQLADFETSEMGSEKGGVGKAESKIEIALTLEK